MRKRKRDAQALLPPAVQIAAIAALAILVLIPIAYTLLLSVTPDVEIGGASLIPSYWAFGNYLQMWSTVSLVQGLSNSLIIAGIASVIAVILSVGAAYIITRFRFRGRRLYLYSLIGLQTVPSVMLLLPLFVLFASIQAALHFMLVGTYEAMIITYLTFALPFAT
jgi:multiple sugar transport system permease protein